jgi:anaerobic ribonucleoside-triphosphate reductase
MTEDNGMQIVNVRKRSGEIVKFDKSRIERAIGLAFKSTFGKYEERSEVVEEVESQLYDEIPCEEIQDIIEMCLMENGYYEVAKSFIIHRHKHSEDRMIEDKKLFIEQYKSAVNASTGSQFDANANVEHKNISTLSGEMYKRESILLNRKILTDKITELYGSDLSEEYIRQLKTHEIYKHDETSILPYCVSINMYPFLTKGLEKLGGHSKPPTHLQAFNGSFINLVFAVASQFAGAVATPEYLMYMDYFIRKAYGNDYYKNTNKQVDFAERGRTIEKVIEDSFQQVVYSLNQPASARNYQAIFWNIGYFDKNYFESMFGTFYFPDGVKAQWESLDWLQKKFMKWFNQERLKTPLTFPVETIALLTDGKDIIDKDYADFTAEMYSEGHSFFTYMSESADSLSSCCRLRNEIADNEFSFSLGAGGVATGSKSVMTININRLVQDAVNQKRDISDAVREQVKKIHKYQTAFNEVMKDNYNSRLLPVFDAGFISLDKQFLTIGINGLVESAEFLGIEISVNEKYQQYIDSILKPIYEENKKAKTEELMFNTEFVPAENLGVKHADWDRKDGYFVPRDVYNSYFFIVEDDSINIIDKIKLHGKSSVRYLDGGSASHLNLDEHLSKQQYRHLLAVIASEGCNYFTFNIPNTLCNDCETIDKRRLLKCPKCGGENLDYLTRIIGYLKRVSSFSLKRQEEEGRRHYGGL